MRVRRVHFGNGPFIAGLAMIPDFSFLYPGVVHLGVGGGAPEQTTQPSGRAAVTGPGAGG